MKTEKEIRKEYDKQLEISNDPKNNAIYREEARVKAITLKYVLGG